MSALPPVRPRRRSRGAGASLVGLAAVALALGVLLGRHRLLSTSVDVAYHLQELEVVRDRWLIPAADQRWLSELWWYPKLSHRLAALLTRAGLNDIDALTTTAVLGAGAAWACLLGWAARAGRAVLAGGLALALAFGFGLGAWTGAEAVENFFFAQLVAEGVAWLTLSALAAWAWERPWTFAAGAAAAVGLCGCVHLLPTLNLAAAFMALFALRLARAWRARRRLSAADALGLVAAPAAAVGNPFFGAMRWIANNDGVITLTPAVSFPLLGAASAALLVLCAGVLAARLVEGREDDAASTSQGRAVEVIAAMGAGVAATALLQLAAFLLRHDGSAYAVRKHGFDVFTLLAFGAPLAASALWRRAPSLLRRPAPGWLAPAALAAVLAAVFLRPSLVEVPAAARLMDDVRRFRPARDLHGVAVLFASDATTPMLAYMADIAMLQARHDDPAVLVTAFTGQPVGAAPASTFVTPVGDGYDRPACRAGAPRGVAVEVRAACAAVPAIGFGAGEAGTAFLREGWADPEHGVWSRAPRATVDLPLPPAARGWRGGWLVIDTFAFLPDQSPRRTVTLSVAGRRVERFTYSTAFARTHLFVAPLDRAGLAPGRVEVRFDVADPVTPAQLGLGADPRRLGVGLSRITVLPDNRR